MPVTRRDRATIYVLLLIAALIVLVIAPLPARGQSLPAADQVYLQTAGHALSGSTTFATELQITNLSDDSIDVSITFMPANVVDDDPRYEFAQFLPRRITLAPHGYREIRDERLAAMVPTGIGMFIFEACKAGMDCSTQYDKVRDKRVEKLPNVRARRPISVTARVYSYAGAAAKGTRGESYPSVPWYDVWTVDGAAVGMDRPFITGVRSDVRNHTNVSIANASDYSTIAIRATLHDGTSGLTRGTFDTAIEALHSLLVGAEVMFPVLAESRLRRQPVVRNPWISFEIVAATLNELATAQKDVSLGCADGCPGFLVQASLIDNATGDVTRLVAQNGLPDRSRQVAAGGVTAFKTAALTTPRSERITDPLHFKFVGPTCSINPADGYWLVSKPKPDGRPWMHVSIEGLVKAREMCGAGPGGSAQ